MGSWTIVVEGHGIHDNDKPEDADARLREFVSQLQADGHVINRASIAVGTRRVMEEDEYGVLYPVSDLPNWRNQ